MEPDASALQAGALVRVRQRTYLIEDVRSAPGASPVVSLACVDDDAQGQHLDVIWDAETDAKVIHADRSALKDDPAAEDPRRFAAYLHALRWSCVTSTDPTLFQAPLRAGIVPKTYQLEPLRKALALPRVNLFIADDVGLGKTIEAGLVLQELLLRHRVNRVVISCPASVLLQWRDELGQRFGLTFAILDKAYVNARRRERGFGVNAWTTHRQFLISHALLRDEDYLTGLRDWLGTFAPASLFILDEAHVAAPASESKYAIDTQTTRAIADVARRFEHRLFLSATPHNGHSNSFSRLLEILDPQRFTRGVPVKDASMLKPVMVRRLKSELRKHLVDSQVPRRDPVQVVFAELPSDSPELVLADKLAAYGDILERRLAGAPNRVKSAGKLVTIALQKRLLSSIEAFAHTLAVHRKNAAKYLAAETPRPDDGATKQAGFSFLADEEEDLAEDTIAEGEDVEVARATQAGGSAEADAQARRLLDEMTSLAAANRDQPDAKVRHIVDWIRAHQCPDLPPLGGKPKGRPTWVPLVKGRPKRLLIFTEYAHSKDYLVQQLEAAIRGTDLDGERTRTLHGGMDEQEREQVKDAFLDPSDPVRVLVATDAAREGINLQAQCADLFHYDLPWNPARIEQRNGRIDRLLQEETVVRCHYFVYAQRPEDAVLKTLGEKTATIHEQLGSLSDVLDRKISERLKDGIARAKIDEIVAAIASVDATADDEKARTAQTELEQAREREVSAQIDDLEKLYEKARAHLDLDNDRLRDVVNLGLSLSGAAPLAPRPSPPGTFDVPPLDKIAAADATWREILDALRPPRKRKVKEWEWRATCPPRPVTFEPGKTLDEERERVQLHLQHKLTQRALAPLRSQAFAEDRLSRVTVVLDPKHARKRVLVLGRLSLYGAGASRLHEEILAAAAYWGEGDDASRLKPFETADAEERALESLYGALSRADAPAAQHITRMLMAHARKDEEVLWKKIKDKVSERIVLAEEKLRQRAVAESEAMRRILEAQRQSIEKELGRRSAERGANGAEQTRFAFLPEEKSQKEEYERDTKEIERRLRDLPKEIEAEPRRVRELYEVKHHRLERVGLVYLWPTTS